MSGPKPARNFANLIIMIGLVSAGLAMLMTLDGNPTKGLYVCAGGAALAIGVLLLGGLVVGSNHPDDEE